MMNLRISLFVFAVSLVGHSSSAVIDLNYPGVNVSLLEPGVIDLELLPSVETILNSGVKPEIVDVADETVVTVPVVLKHSSLQPVSVVPVKIAVDPIEKVIEDVVSEPEVEGVEGKLLATPVEVEVVAAKSDEPLLVVEPSLENVDKKELELVDDKVAPVSAVVEKSAAVAEGISDAVSSPATDDISVAVSSLGAVGISAPVSAILVETANLNPAVELEKDCVKETVQPLNEIKETLVTESVPVSPSITVSSSPDVVSVLSSPSANIQSTDPEGFPDKSNKEKHLIHVSKNIYRTEEGDLVKLEVLERSTVKREEIPTWVKVAPLPYPPRSIIGRGALKVSHINEKYTSVPAASQMQPMTPKTLRVSKKFMYNPLRSNNPRSRFGMNPAVDQQFVTSYEPEGLAGCASENGRCFWYDCIYDIAGYPVYCW